MIDSATINDLLDELEDEDDTSTAQKGLAVLKGGKADETEPPMKAAEPGDDAKLKALVEALSPAEKDKLRELLNEDDGGTQPGEE